VPRLAPEQTADIETELETVLREWLDKHSFEMGEIIRDAFQRAAIQWMDRNGPAIMDRIARERQ
jgi:hypothetical protein